jgi:CheY-like chemotaxis protein
MQRTEDSSGGFSERIRRYLDCDVHGIPMSRVLFVSHDSDLREVASRVLRRVGHDVTPAAHAGHASLACLDQDAFDVLVIENELPDGTSAAIVERVRRSCPALQVVRLCEPVATVMGKGIAVVRPFTADELVDAVVESAATAALVPHFVA